MSIYLLYTSYIYTVEYIYTQYIFVNTHVCVCLYAIKCRKNPRCDLSLFSHKVIQWAWGSASIELQLESNRSQIKYSAIIAAHYVNTLAYKKRTGPKNDIVKIVTDLDTIRNEVCLFVVVIVVVTFLLLAAVCLFVVGIWCTYAMAPKTTFKCTTSPTTRIATTTTSWSVCAPLDKHQLPSCGQASGIRAHCAGAFG